LDGLTFFFSSYCVSGPGAAASIASLAQSAATPSKRQITKIPHFSGIFSKMPPPYFKNTTPGMYAPWKLGVCTPEAGRISPAAALEA